MLFADARVTAKGFKPVRFGEILPAVISGGKESQFVRERPPCRQARGPGA
jgi:hypothetical protein